MEAVNFHLSHLDHLTELDGFLLLFAWGLFPSVWGMVHLSHSIYLLGLKNPARLGRSKSCCPLKILSHRPGAASEHGLCVWVSVHDAIPMLQSRPGVRVFLPAFISLLTWLGREIKQSLWVLSGSCLYRYLLLALLLITALKFRIFQC